MTEPQTQSALALHRAVLRSLKESDLEGVIDTLMQLYAPAAIADIVHAKTGVMRLHDFVRPTTEIGTWRVQEIKEDASGIRIQAARHPDYDYTVSGPPELFIALEAEVENRGDSHDDWEALQQELDKAPKVKAYLKQLSQEFMQDDLLPMALVDAVCTLVGSV